MRLFEFLILTNTEGQFRLGVENLIHVPSQKSSLWLYGGSTFSTYQNLSCRHTSLK